MKLLIATISLLAVILGSVWLWKSNDSLIHCGPPKESGIFKNIGNVILLWKQDHSGTFPSSLESIFSDGYLSSDLKDYKSVIQNPEFRYFLPTSTSKQTDILLQFPAPNRSDIIYIYYLNGDFKVTKIQG